MAEAVRTRVCPEGPKKFWLAVFRTKIFRPLSGRLEPLKWDRKKAEKVLPAAIAGFLFHLFPTDLDPLVPCSGRAWPGPVLSSGVGQRFPGPWSYVQAREKDFSLVPFRDSLIGGPCGSSGPLRCISADFSVFFLDKKNKAYALNICLISLFLCSIGSYFTRVLVCNL